MAAARSVRGRAALPKRNDLVTDLVRGRLDGYLVAGWRLMEWLGK